LRVISLESIILLSKPLECAKKETIEWEKPAFSLNRAETWKEL